MHAPWTWIRVFVFTVSIGHVLGVTTAISRTTAVPRPTSTLKSIPGPNDFPHRLDIGPNDQTSGNAENGNFQYPIYSGLATYDQDTSNLFTDKDLWGLGQSPR